MTPSNKPVSYRPFLAISIVILLAAVIWSVAFRHPKPKIQQSHQQPAKTTNETPAIEPLPEPTLTATPQPAISENKSQLKNNHKSQPEPPVIESEAQIKAAPTITLSEVVRGARTWQPAFQNWYGKSAPDFTLPDIAGKNHTLSDYRGRNVMIVFWATWCNPCLREIPHLVELRNTIGNDKLAILAISNEEPYRVRHFSDKQNINYTVLLAAKSLPSPFSNVNAIPCSFFIQPDGKIKLATVGLLSLAPMKAIIHAEGR